MGEKTVLLREGDKCNRLGRNKRSSVVSVDKKLLSECGSYGPNQRG